jgi:gamma-glutamyltranspeptidase/glutathione hydrolase
MQQDGPVSERAKIELFLGGIHRINPWVSGGLRTRAATCKRVVTTLHGRSRAPTTPHMLGLTRTAAVIAFFFAISTPALAAEPASATLVSGSAGAVAAEHRLASEAGAEILRAGGNAVDAAIAASLAGSVVNPGSAGLGGGGFMVIYLVEEARAHALDYRETAPSAAHRDMFVRDGVVDKGASKRGGMAVGVPGEAAGLELALERFGSMTTAQVAAPAIRLASQGFVVESHLARGLEKQREALAADPVLAAEFLHEDGQPYRAGETLKRPAFAASLSAFAQSGSTAFYKGEIAQQIVAAVAKSGGSLSAEDLANYRVVQRRPVISTFHGRQVVGMPPPSSGGGVIGEVLGILTSDHLEELEHNSATYLHLLAEAFKAAFADRAKFYGDPDFVDVELDKLLAPARLERIRSSLSPAQAVAPETYGNIVVGDDSGTSHVSVIDSKGNAVACTTSINTSFGAKVGAAGFPLNNTMDDFSLQPGVANVYGLVGSEANSIAAGKRPLSSMSPTIVLADGKPRLALGASGGPLIITATTQTLLNALVFSMDIGSALSASRIHHQWLPNRLVTESTLGSAVSGSLARRGHQVVVYPFAAAVQAAESVNENGKAVIRAASDARKGGVAAAE